MEGETQVQIGENLGYVAEDETQKLPQSYGEVGRILNGLISSVSKHD
jgi:hypothetical protein